MKSHRTDKRGRGGKHPVISQADLKNMENRKLAKSMETINLHHAAKERGFKTMQQLQNNCPYQPCKQNTVKNYSEKIKTQN